MFTHSDPCTLIGLRAALTSPTTYHLGSALPPLSTSPSFLSSNRALLEIFSHSDGMSRVLKAPSMHTPDSASSQRTCTCCSCPQPGMSFAPHHCVQSRLRRNSHSCWGKGNQHTGFISHPYPSFLGTRISATTHHMTVSESYSRFYCTQQNPPGTWGKVLGRACSYPLTS